jgi:hypothetical protein
MKTTYLYRAALLCGALPLLTGISVFSLWAITRWSWLGEVGIYTILGGLLLFVLGTGMLLAFWRESRRSPAYSQRQLWLRTLVAASLLLSNFPAAAAILGGTGYLAMRYVLVVENTSPLPFRDARMSGGGNTLELGTIPPGGSVRRSFSAREEGSLELSGTWGEEKRVEIFDYVSPGLGDLRRVKIRPDGVIAAEPGTHPFEPPILPAPEQ